MYDRDLNKQKKGEQIRKALLAKRKSRKAEVP